MTPIRRFAGFVSIGLAIAGLSMMTLAACGDDDGDNDDTAAATAMAKTGDLEIFDGWARTTTNDVSAAYFVVKNSGLEDTLVAATADITPMTQLHEVVTDGATSKMQEKAGGFTVPAKGEVTLKPGGYHVMLMNLTEPLAEGDTVKLELEFEKAGKVSITVPVKPGPAMEMGGAMGQ
jgi:copper(I)-binding protein